jgi:hypothetical protein
MSAMTYQTIADLLADPALGKLEALREYVTFCRDEYDHYRVLEDSDWDLRAIGACDGIDSTQQKADAALLAVANARDFAVDVTMQSMVKRCEELDMERAARGADF